MYPKAHVTLVSTNDVATNDQAAVGGDFDAVVGLPSKAVHCDGRRSLRVHDVRPAFGAISHPAGVDVRAQADEPER